MAFAPFYYDPKLDFERVLDEQAVLGGAAPASSTSAVAQTPSPIVSPQAAPG